MKIRTINNIEVLLHYYLMPTAHPRIDAPVVADATAMLLKTGCIVPDEYYENQYVTTSKGAAWVKALCNVEIPREVFVDQNGNVLS